MSQDQESAPQQGRLPDFVYWRVKYADAYTCKRIFEEKTRVEKYGRGSVPGLRSDVVDGLYKTCVASVLGVRGRHCLPSPQWLDAVMTGKTRMSTVEQNQLLSCVQGESVALDAIERQFSIATNNSKALKTYLTQTKYFSNTTQPFDPAKDTDVAIVSKTSQAMSMCREEAVMYKDCMSRGKGGKTLEEQEQTCFVARRRFELCQMSILAAHPLMSCMREYSNALKREDTAFASLTPEAFAFCADNDSETHMTYSLAEDLPRQLDRLRSENQTESKDLFASLVQIATKEDKPFDIARASSDQVAAKVREISDGKCSEFSYDVRSCLRSQKTGACGEEFQRFGSCLFAFICAEPLRYCLVEEGLSLETCMNSKTYVEDCLRHPALNTQD